MFKLVIQDDEGKTTVVPLIRDEITIGRKEGNTIRLTERNVSRRHARILRSNNEVQIEDLGSYNGIRVNNARIAERVSLRISDQVQIGDYKLYLKAEGVEQVDDARTMPIERIENVGTTEAMPAVAGSGTPTAPIPPTPAPARTLGVADTDPAGRPVATAAQITALNPPSGHGKLVVLSSNFAGKEFELTRPQMIVGRTDENDLVVNHRSISRNHAKITRDTDTLRYTISDLQSSNGVRVNGQDYGKVELRRGDVVDLGHVRLRFVEPGEDFVFARDAVIADVEGTGPKKGMMIAIILAVVVIGAVGAFFLLKSKSDGGKTNGSNDGSSGSDQLVGSAGSAGSAVVAIAPDPIDAAQDTSPGSNSATVPTADEGKKVAAECDAIIAEAHWDTLKMCADKLKPFDAAKAAELSKRALAETGFEQKHDSLKAALAEGNLAKARKALAEIPDSSAYHKDAEDAYNAAEQKAVDEMKAKAQALAQQNKCKDIDILITQSAAKSQRVVDAVRPFKCAPAAVPVPEDCSQNLRNPDSKECKKQFCAGHADNSRCPPTIVQPACNAEVLVDTGTQAEGRGDHGSALVSFEAAYRCKKDAHTLAVTFMAACNAGKPDAARKYWKVMSSDTQNHLLQICLHNHITKDILDAQ
jgi:pSer/pThr/pTyr-binding forkhead associated (FHA) protein/Skp family chaperone for outer membrane proteins